MKDKLQIEAYESVLIHYIGIKTKAQIDLELTPIDNVSMQGYQKIERKRLSDLIELTDIKIEMQQELKQKYFTNNFYWVNKENYKRLQEIALEVGCLCHTGKAEIIEWHEGFKNLGFRTYEKNNNVTVFQKEPFLLHNHTATDFNEMLSAYENVATCI